MKIQFKTYYKLSYKNLSKFIIFIRNSIKSENQQYVIKYRLTDWIKGNVPANDKVKIHIIGTRNEIVISPRNIIHDDEILCGFSPLDIKTIAMLAFSYRARPKYEIMVNEFRHALHEEIITIKERGKSTCIKQSVQELSKNLDLIDGFSPIDAFNLGRVSGETETILYHRKLNGLKKTC